MSWVIRGYGPDDELRTEIRFDDLVRGLLRTELSRPDDDPMFDSYPVPTELVERLLSTFGFTRRGEDADYFIDFDV